MLVLKTPDQLTHRRLSYPEAVGGATKVELSGNRLKGGQLSQDWHALTITPRDHHEVGDRLADVGPVDLDGGPPNERILMQATTVLWTYATDVEITPQARGAHLEYLETLVTKGQLLAAGPRGDRPGGVLLFAPLELTEIQQLLADDPFSALPLIVDTQIVPWTTAIGSLTA